MAKKRAKKEVKRHLSDYVGEEAIELWADIFEPASDILGDAEVQKYTTGKGIDVNKAAVVIAKKYPKQTYTILERISEDEVNGANLFARLMAFVFELIAGDKASAFFKPAEPGNSVEEPSGSAMENTEGGEI